jgi:pimeloyl-ACP methyl ester carboxylesterase
MARTQYARSGDVSIAYQVHGDGPMDLVYVPGWVSNIELMWDDPVLASILRRLGSFARVITFDKRGTGLSDRVPDGELPDLETRADDLRAVMDSAGSQRATLLGHSEGGNLSTLFAAAHPERVEGLILVASYAKRIWSEDYPWAPKPADREAEIAEAEATWGDPDAIPGYMLGSRADDRSFRDWVARYLRLGASPRAAATLLRMSTQMDTRAALPLIQAPTLCIYRTDDQDVLVEEGRWIASRIPDARLVELPGNAHLFYADDPTRMLDEIEEFMTGRRESAEPDRVLATVLYTDIVGSTERAAELGDHQWRTLVERHDRIVADQVSRFRGRVVKQTGDGVVAVFDGPGRAIRAATAIGAALQPLGLEVRAGVHSGEVEIVGDDYAGLAFHIGARIASLADAGEVLVSRTVRDLVVGSSFEFAEHGTHQLKGVPGDWDVYAVG